MVTLLIKSIITFASVLFVLRIMGKRQLGEMQPFELVITLILADVACIPVNDPYVPLYFGLIPIVTLGTLHLIISFIVKKNMLIRRFVSGRSVIVIDGDGIKYDSLKKMNLNMNDLIVAVRSGGYVDFNMIAYAIFETNGKLCVVEKPSSGNQSSIALLPITLFIDGDWDEPNLAMAKIEKEQIQKLFRDNGIKKDKDILYVDCRNDGLVYVSPKYQKCFVDNIHIGGQW